MKCLIVDANQRPDALNLRSDPFLYGLINGMHEGMRFVKINEQHPIQTIQLGLPGQLQVNNHAD